MATPSQASQSQNQTQTQTASADGGGEDFFHRLLDIVNPLQHLPVVGTLYRAATGEHIGPFEKIAGDTLYGGLWGAVSSVAELGFEQLTGKSPEDTVLAWLKPDNSIQVAQTKVKAVQIAANTSLPSADTPDLPVQLASTNSREFAALTGALSAKGVDGETAARALYAYRQATSASPVFASLN